MAVMFSLAGIIAFGIISVLLFDCAMICECKQQKGCILGNENGELVLSLCASAGGCCEAIGWIAAFASMYEGIRAIKLDWDSVYEGHAGCKVVLSIR